MCTSFDSLLDKVSLDGDELYSLSHGACRKMQSRATCDLRPVVQLCNVRKNLVLVPHEHGLFGLALVEHTKGLRCVL